MKNFKSIIILLLISSLTLSCFEDNDDNLKPASNTEINDFVWKAMNVWYLYKDEVSNLANNRFNSNEEYTNYLKGFSSPEELFESLIHQRLIIDKFSWITSDYIANEQLLGGKSFSNGMRFATFPIDDTSNVRYGIVLYVQPNTSAEEQGIKRGDIFYAIDNTQLTSNNISSLTSSNSYTISLGTYNTNGTPETTDDSVDSIDKEVTLTKIEYIANPIFLSKTFNINNKKVGYLMYNAFNGSSSDLNNVFGNFKNQGVTNLVLDLRYNPGGFTSKAILMSSLIAGQFTGDVMNINQYNQAIQEAFENQNPELLLDRFISSEDGMTLNSLSLDKVYILTTNATASASELVINSLRPYMPNLIHIGNNTAGKYQGSRTLYDSNPPNFFKEGVNLNHTYALQPLTFKYSNINGNTDFINGLSPDAGFQMFESVINPGVLGDENEPLLAKALQDIENSGRPTNNKSGIEYQTINSLIDYQLPSGILIEDK